MSQKNSSARVSRRQKMLNALDLRAAGGSYDQIARAIGCSRSTAWKLVAAAIDEVNEKCHESAERVKRIEIMRMDQIRVMLWPKRSDPRVADTLIRLSERTAKLHGIDAPTKTELTGADRGPVQVQTGSSGPDLTKLSDEEIAALGKINKKLKG